MSHNEQLRIACLCLLLAACNRPDPIRLEPTIEEPAALVSRIRISDSSTSTQLVNGFYPLEANAWRWAEPRFTVDLAVPPGAREQGAQLVLAFSLPDISIQRLKKITVSAALGGVTLSPEEYTTPGAHQYRRDVPASAFTKAVAEADFTVDKFLQLDTDRRRLALVVTEIGLEPK